MQNGYYERGFVWPVYERELPVARPNVPQAVPAPDRADDGADYCRSAIQEFYARRAVGGSVGSRGDQR